MDQLNNFPKGAVMDAAALLEAGILKKTGDAIKILGKGQWIVPVIKINMVSRGAKEKIEAAGGTVEVI